MIRRTTEYNDLTPDEGAFRLETNTVPDEPFSALLSEKMKHRE